MKDEKYPPYVDLIRAINFVLWHVEAEVILYDLLEELVLRKIVSIDTDGSLWWVDSGEPVYNGEHTTNR